MLKPITEEQAIELATNHKASRLIVVAVDDQGFWSYATFGRPGSDFEHVTKWAESCGEQLAAALAGLKPDCPSR